MANRFWVNQSFQLEKSVVRLYAQVTFGGTGAPTLVTANSKGVVSVTRNSAGKYTVVLGTNAANLDQYPRLLMVDVNFDATGNGGSAPASPLTYLTGNAVNTAGSCSFQFQCTNSAGTATDPASGEKCFVEITLSNSGAY